MSAPFPRPDQPLPNLWSDRDRGRQESTLDSETAVSLACHLHDAFADASDWNSLLDALADRGFSLEFQADRLTLINNQTNVRLCTCSVLGHGLAELTARLGKPCVQATTHRLMRSPTDDSQR